MTKGQISLEALLASAAFLLAVAVLASSAARISDAMRLSVLQSSERMAISQEALVLDMAGWAVPQTNFSHQLSGLPSAEGRVLSSRRTSNVSEPLFHQISADSSGGVYVFSDLPEPV